MPTDRPIEDATETIEPPPRFYYVRLPGHPLHQISRAEAEFCKSMPSRGGRQVIESEHPLDVK